MKTIEVKTWKEVPKNFTGEIKINDEIIYQLNGKIHRLDGPAVIYTCGFNAYWINGKLISYCKQEFYDSNEYKQIWKTEENIN